MSLLKHEVTFRDRKKRRQITFDYKNKAALLKYTTNDVQKEFLSEVEFRRFIDSIWNSKNWEKIDAR